MEIVTIDDEGTITIRLNKDLLAHAAEFHPDLETYNEDDGFIAPNVTDKLKFAQEVFRQLRMEEEDGTTLVHKMFDNAIVEAIENGAEGIVLGDDE